MSPSEATSTQTITGKATASMNSTRFIRTVAQLDPLAADRTDHDIPSTGCAANS